MNRSKLMLVAGCGAASLATSQAIAQEAASASGLEEIVVTAQKRTELLKNVPASVTAVTTQSFQNLNAAKLEDYVARIPALSVLNVSMAQASTQITIR